MLAVLKKYWRTILVVLASYIVNIIGMYVWASSIKSLPFLVEILAAMFVIAIPSIVFYTADKLKPKPKAPKRGQHVPKFDLQGDIKKFTDSHKN